MDLFGDKGNEVVQMPTENTESNEKYISSDIEAQISGPRVSQRMSLDTSEISPKNIVIDMGDERKLTVFQWNAIKSLLLEGEISAEEAMASGVELKRVYMLVGNRELDIGMGEAQSLSRMIPLLLEGALDGMNIKVYEDLGNSGEQGNIVKVVDRGKCRLII